MGDQERAEKIVEKMMDNDTFSQRLGIRIVEIKPGFAKLQLEIDNKMINGFGISHGGVVYSLADSALAFASNSYGRVAVALENNISYMRKVIPGDILTAKTEELSIGNRIGVYNILVTNQRADRVALFRGTVFRTGEQHDGIEY